MFNITDLKNEQLYGKVKHSFLISDLGTGKTIMTIKY